MAIISSSCACELIFLTKLIRDERFSDWVCNIVSNVPTQFKTLSYTYSYYYSRNSRHACIEEKKNLKFCYLKYFICHWQTEVGTWNIDKKFIILILYHTVILTSITICSIICWILKSQGSFQCQKKHPFFVKILLVK